MLRVTLEIVPFGIESVKRTIGTLEISNVGGNHKVGSYSVTATDRDGGKHFAQIERYRRGRGGWNLVKKALQIIKFE